MLIEEILNESNDIDPFSEIDNDTIRDLAGIRMALMPISDEDWASILVKRLEKAGYVLDRSQKKFVKGVADNESTRI